MNTITKLLITSILFFFSCVVFSQEIENSKIWKDKPGFRFGGGMLIDKEGGYGLFVEFSIPLIKSLEMAPAFTFATTFDTEFNSNSFIKNDVFFSSQSTSTVETKDLNYMLSAIDVNMYFKPFDFFNSEKMKKHQLLLGGGLGFRHFIKNFVFINQNINTGQYELSGINQKINGEIGTNLAVQYNYFVNKRLSVGAKFLTILFDGEGTSLLALQAGIRL